MNYGPTPYNPATDSPKRRELRLPATLNVRILGIDANGKAFHQPATTLDISMSGARITGLAAKLNPGDIVGLQSGGAKSRFKVAWVRSNRDGSLRDWAALHREGRMPVARPAAKAGERG